MICPIRRSPGCRHRRSGGLHRTLARARQQLLSMAKGRHRQATPCSRACRSGPDGLGRLVGELALARGREGAQLCDHHDETEWTVRRVARSDAGHSRSSELAGLAWEGAHRSSAAEGDARALPVRRDDVWPVRARVGNVKNNDASLIEPLAQTGHQDASSPSYGTHSGGRAPLCPSGYGRN